MRLRLRATTPLLLLLIAAACGKSAPAGRTFDAVKAERRDLAASAIADGTVEPILTVEVKSKASGEIIQIPVDTGDDIRPGQVLVRIDPLDNQNAFDQADANLRAAIASQDTTRAALTRSTNLHATGLLTDSDFDQVRLQASEAEADAVKARIALDTAKRRLDETTVRSPMAGTILTRGVEVGNVIASAVSQVSGGTVLMTMADLSTIQVRSLVDEADIGRIAAGMAARVTVEAHPGRVYEGTVRKIEPQAVTAQNVTLFPVLVHLPNSDGSLRPGMNAEVEILIDRRHDVLTVPAEALRSPKEAAAAARFLGLELQAQDGTVQAAETGAGRDRTGGAAPGMRPGPQGRRGERGGRNGAPSAGEAKAPAGRPAVVFVEGASGPEMRSVVAGLSDWEYTEVLSGLADGEKVLLLPSTTVMRQEQEAQERFRRSRTMPGMDGSGKAKQGGRPVRLVVELWEILRAALSAIRANLLRATLTMLGIIIGVGAVITMVALGEGAKQSVQDRIQALGTDNFTLRPGNFTMGGVTRGEVQLTVADADALEQRATTIAAIVPEMRGNQQVERGIANASLTVTGTTANWLEVNRFEMDVGRFLSPEDLEGRRKVAVLGAAVLPQLQTTAREVLGEEVTIAGLRFEVVGVMKEKGGATFFNPDEQLLIPLTTARLRVFGRDSLSSITVQATSPKGVDRSMLEIEKLMRREHRLHEGQENNFRFFRQSSLLSTFEETSRTFAILLAAIAAVSLAVGGIGIMNIMLVSVTERTREIGVRKALGATRRVILSQFLAEALTLCLLGGAIGVAVGIGASHLLAQSAGWRTIVTGNSVGLAVAVSAGVGIFFGLYPAARASRLDPIEALRYE